MLTPGRSKRRHAGLEFVFALAVVLFIVTTLTYVVVK